MERMLEEDGRRYLERINALTDRMAQPWMDWPALGGVELDVGSAFPAGYGRYRSAMCSR